MEIFSPRAFISVRRAVVTFFRFFSSLDDVVSVDMRFSLLNWQQINANFRKGGISKESLRMQSKPWATPTKDVALQQLNQGMGVAIGKLLGNVMYSRLSRILVEIISSSFSNLHYLCSTKVRRMQKKFQFALLALILASVWGCSTDFEVYAPEKEIR